MNTSLPSSSIATQEAAAPSRRQPLDSILLPRTLAVIGATERPGSVGRTLLENLKSFGGAVYSVNPKRTRVLGARSYPNLRALPEKIDLAVIATPAITVPEVIEQCVESKVPGAVILSAGFKERGSDGAGLEHQILAKAMAANMRILGPNCLGVMMPHINFNATFAANMAHTGNLAFISQSGALCTAILDWSLREQVGFSAFISVGSMLDVGWGDLIYYLGDDLYTKSIVIYMESIGDARTFLSAAREVALTKPIIVIKAGQTEAAARAAASHTGSLTGSDEVLDAAFQRAGVLRVSTIQELFDMAEVLGKQPNPKGPRLAIVTNAGGPGVLATDMLISRGGQLAELSPATFEELNYLLPPHWSHNNPIDVLGDAGPERFTKAVEIVARDPDTHGLLAILTPQSMTDPAATAQQLKAFAQLDGKPILASCMGGRMMEQANHILNQAHIPTFDYPDTAARAFCDMWRYNSNLSALYETPTLGEQSERTASNREEIAKRIQTARKTARTILSEIEAKQILAAYGIPTVATRIATAEAEATRLAKDIGYPVALKLHSETITHKTDVGGVKLNLQDAAAVRRAYRAIEASVKEKAGSEHFLGVAVQPMISHDEGLELILGSSIDPQFGPVLLFGAGGTLVEVFKDRALGLPPLNATLARRMMEQTRVYGALKGVRGRKAVDLPELEQLLVRFSQLVLEQPWIKEIDINPLLAAPGQLMALDARIVLQDNTILEDKLPKSAIRAYPSEYTTRWSTKEGTEVTIRAIRPEDEPLLVDFHVTLSDRTVYYRYFNLLKLGERISHQRLTRICFNDYRREIALVADHTDAMTGQHEILGVGRLSKAHGFNEAEFAIVVSDRWQNQGLGTELLKRLVQIGRAEKLSRITGTVLRENREMQHLCTKLGFQLLYKPGEVDVRAEIALTRQDA